MTDITIPREALEKAAEAQYKRWRSIHDNGTFPDWDQLDHSIREGYRADARADCLAMLISWPGIHSYARYVNPLDMKPEVTAIVLPLTEKPSHE